MTLVEKTPLWRFFLRSPFLRSTPLALLTAALGAAAAKKKETFVSFFSNKATSGAQIFSSKPHVVELNNELSFSIQLRVEQGKGTLIFVVVGDAEFPKQNEKKETADNEIRRSLFAIFLSFSSLRLRTERTFFNYK